MLKSAKHVHIWKLRNGDLCLVTPTPGLLLLETAIVVVIVNMVIFESSTSFIIITAAVVTILLIASFQWEAVRANSYQAKLHQYWHCLHMRNSNSDWDYLLMFRCKHWKNKDMWHCSVDFCWPYDIVPSKIKSNLNCRCPLTCNITEETPNTKLKYCLCTSSVLLNYRNEQIFNGIWQMMTYNWCIWIVTKQNFSTCLLFCGFEVLVALATEKDLTTMVYAGSYQPIFHANEIICILTEKLR